MELEKYRQSAENFLSKLDKEYYLHFAGLKDELNTSAIYEENSWLFEMGNFSAIKGLKDKAVSVDEGKRLQGLLKFCGEGLIENKVKELSDSIAEQEAKAVIGLEGREVSYRYSEILLSNEADKAKRDEIDDCRNELVKKEFNDKLMQYWSELHLQAGSLGFSSYREMFSFLKGEDFTTTLAQMEKLLDQTRDIYEQHFGNLLLKVTGIGLGSSRKSDFAKLRRAPEFDRYFKKEMLIEVFRDTLIAMGIDVARQSNIIFDVEERKNKSPRAFCATVRVPDEIYLVVMPRGGQDDYEAMFHEGGHAQHFSNTRASLDFEFKFLGDNAVTEGYAFTLEHLMQNSQWLQYFLKLSAEDAREFVYLSSIIKLWFCRRYAGKLKYELELHDGTPITGKEHLYRQILSGVSMMNYSDAEYLKDVDEGFYCTNYIRAWIFEAQLKDYIHNKFGYGWAKQKKAGDFLREIWSYGQKYDPSEILGQLGYGKLDVDYLISSIISGIKENS